MVAPAPLAGAGRVAGAAALIAVLTVASRLAGFGRTGIFTWVVGTTDLGGVYVVANTVPNIVFEIVAGGALASLVVPLLAGAVAAGDRRAVAATTGALLTWTVTLLVPLAVLVAVFAGPIVSLIIGDPTPAQRDAGARMLRVFAPQLPLYGIGIVLTGVLQAHRRFAWPVLAPLLSSLTVIGVYLLFGAVEGRHDGDRPGRRRRPADPVGRHHPRRGGALRVPAHPGAPAAAATATRVRLQRREPPPDRRPRAGRRGDRRPASRSPCW